MCSYRKENPYFYFLSSYIYIWPCKLWLCELSLFILAFHYRFCKVWKYVVLITICINTLYILKKKVRGGITPPPPPTTPLYAPPKFPGHPTPLKETQKKGTRARNKTRTQGACKKFLFLIHIIFINKKGRIYYILLLKLQFFKQNLHSCLRIDVSIIAERL